MGLEDPLPATLPSGENRSGSAAPNGVGEPSSRPLDPNTTEILPTGSMELITSSPMKTTPTTQLNRFGIRGLDLRTYRPNACAR